jgi:ornithine cyclodeaminase/alanine dehydrogenase
MVLLLDRDDVISVLQMKDCIDAMEAAFVELAHGTAELPLRINIKPPGGLCLYMPAYLREMNALACKVVSVYKDNPVKHNVPTTIGKVLLQNPQTGEVICIMDGGYLTAVRTGAVSGLATKFLARQAADQTVGIFGAGVQARMQLWAVSEVRKIARALVYDIQGEAAKAFAEEMSETLSLPVEPVKSAEACLEADILCTATSSASPIFDGKKVREGTHINAIGSHSPKARELDTAIVKRSMLIADSREACLSEAGDIMIPIESRSIKASHIHADLAEIVSHKVSGRTTGEQITLFKSNGLAIQDAATAKLVFESARAKGVGVEVEL